MNQATNKIPYGLLTEEEQGDFCKDAKQRGLYDNWVSGCDEAWERSVESTPFQSRHVYQIKIVTGEIYYYRMPNCPVPLIAECSSKNNYLITEFRDAAEFRPATKEEIKRFKPKKEKWILWQKDCGIQKPTEYRDVHVEYKYPNSEWLPLDEEQEPFTSASVYRYKL